LRDSAPGHDSPARRVFQSAQARAAQATQGIQLISWLQLTFT
jgi:hypothetical protein